MDFKLNKSNLNFRVYTAETAPATGSENDICVISSVPMKNWMLSPDNPVNAPRNNGDVWIRYSVSGNTFNALKNGSMMIATVSTWQYVSGAWVGVSAVIYQNGEWIDFVKWLYNPGSKDILTSIGWQGDSSKTAAAPLITYGSSSVAISSNGGNGCAYFEKRDLTDAETIRFDLSFEGVVNSAYPYNIVGIWSEVGTGYYMKTAVKKETIVVGDNTISIAVDDLQGEYYIGIGLLKHSADVVCTVHSAKID